MSQYGHFLQEQKKADKYLGQRNELLAAAKKVLRQEVVVAADDLDAWQCCMRALRNAVARCEEKKRVIS